MKVVPENDLRERVQRIVRERGLVGAAASTGIGASVLRSIATGAQVFEGSLFLVHEALGLPPPEFKRPCVLSQAQLRLLKELADIEVETPEKWTAVWGPASGLARRLFASGLLSLQQIKIGLEQWRINSEGKALLEKEFEVMASYDGGGFAEWLRDSLFDPTPDQLERITKLLEPHREMIETSLSQYEPEEHSWRDYRNALWEHIPEECNREMDRILGVEGSD